MTLRLPRRHLRLEHKVAILTALPILLLGVVVGARLDAMSERRMLAASETGIAPVARTLTQLLITPGHFERAFPAELVATLDKVVGVSIDNGLADGLRMYRSDGLVLWSSFPGEIGEHHDLSPHTRRAADGEVQATLTDGDATSAPVPGEEDGLIAVAVPAEDPRTGRVIGFTEVYLPDDEFRAALADDRREIMVVLGAGLLALWALLGNIVVRASRTLRRQAAENQHLALHDTLTGLPNRTFFNSSLERALARASRDPTRGVGVLLLDLDRFKEVNDSLGHHEGDRLLVQVADRLRGAIRAGDTVARFGGDEFAVVLHDIRGVEDAVAGAHRIHHALDEPVELGELRIQVDASIGVAVFPDHGDAAGSLVQRADVAMYAAKSAGLDVAVYDAGVDPNSPHRLALVSQLRAAIDSDQLCLHYQPVTHIRTGRTVAMEALVRWDHPVRGLVSPSEFIPAAEGSGLIRPLTLRVLREAMCQCRRWLDAGIDVSVAVNLSARNIQDPRCPDDVRQLLEETGLPADHLVLEITEHAVLGDPGTAMRVLTELRSLGARIALDDFGTGYSSLTQLKDLPVDEIKIDRSFVSRVGEDPTTTAIVESVVELGGRLDVHVVAEGVEDAEGVDRLATIGCELAQGYYFSRPLPPDEAADWLARHAPRRDRSATADRNGAR